MASPYSPCPFIFFCKPSAPCKGSEGPDSPLNAVSGRVGEVGSRPGHYLSPISAAVNKTKPHKPGSAAAAGRAIAGRLGMLGTSHPHLQSSLKLFPLVFFSLANGHWPWAGFRQVIYVFSSLNKWPCLKVGQMEGEKKIQASFCFGQAKICS